MSSFLIAEYIDDGAETEVLGVVEEINHDSVRRLLAASDFEYTEGDVDNLVTSRNTYTYDDVEMYFQGSL